MRNYNIPRSNSHSILMTIILLSRGEKETTIAQVNLEIALIIVKSATYQGVTLFFIISTTSKETNPVVSCSCC